MNEESQNSWIEPELEARIVALVLGEASDFEQDELNRLIEHRPELAAFKSRMQQMHGLLRDVAASEFVPQGEDWKLSADRRNAVLAVIRGEATIQPANRDLNQSTQQRVSGKRGLRWNLTKVAAVLCVAGFVGIKAWPSFFLGERSNSGYFSQLAKTDAPHDEMTLSRGTSLSIARETGSAGAAGELYVRSGSGELDPKNNSASALSAIQDTLRGYATLPSPDYLTDDVQYFPGGPEFKLPASGAQREITLWETQGRATATMENAPLTMPEPADAPELIAKNETTWMYKGLRDDVRDGDALAIPQPMAPNASDGEVSFPKPADSLGEVDVATSAAAPAPPTVDVPDRGKVLAGAIEAPTVSEVAPSAGEPIALLPRIMIENEGRDFSVITQGTGSLNGTLSFPDAPRSGKASNESLLGMQDLGSQPAGPVGGGGGFGGMPDDSGSMGGGGEFGLNLPSDEWNKAMPNGAHGIAPIEIDGIANFDDSEFKKAQSKVQDRSFLGKAHAEEELPAKESLDSASIAMPGPAEQAAGESVLPETDWSSAVADKDTELTNTKSDETVRGLDVAPQNGQTGVNGESDSILTPAPIADTNKGQPPFTYFAYGFNDVPQFSERLPLKQLEQQVESRQKSREQASGGRELWSEGTDSRFRYVRPALDDNSSFRERPEAKTVAPPAGLNEKTAAEDAFSTFSLHVSDVSFKLALAALARGEWPEAAKIRIEEFVNAFDYGDPMPCKGERVACLVEQSIHPFVQQRNLLRMSMRTAAEGRSSTTPLHLTFLLDNSGSMERTDRQQTVRRAFDLLSQQLTAIDQVTLISFARQPRLLADKVSGAESGQLVRLIDELPSEGGTNIEAALQLAFEKAKEQQTPNAQNRIILLTDGAVNLGDADPESLSRMVSTMREAGIAFDAAGISAEGLNDEVLEALTRKGDGRYYLLDSLEDADDGFARQIAGALRPSARNVKVQIEFNPKRVGSYKLLGFEKHILKQEDFHNDSVDAAEMAAAEAGVALYQFEAKPDGEGDVGSVSVRFRDLSTGQMIENRWPIPYEADAPRPDQAAPSLRIAASAALLAAKLRGEPLGETVDLQMLSYLISSLPDQDRSNTRVQQLQLMIEQARQLSGK